MADAKPGPGDARAYVPFSSFGDWDASGWDSSTVDASFDQLAKTKTASTPEVMERALEIARREAAVDTGAIEGLYPTDRGFTRSVAEQAAGWENEAERRGEHVPRTIEDALRAFERVLDAATTKVPLTEAWIRILHEVACASQEDYEVLVSVGGHTHWEKRELVKGAYKTQPNNPTTATGAVHHYAPVIDTPIEMERLVNELRSEAFQAAHPVLQAAYAHYAFIQIHPFPDGNGRVARTLASVFLYRSPGVPLVVFADRRNDYLDALEATDRSDAIPLVRFVGECVMDTIGLLSERLRAAAGEATKTATAIGELLAGRITADTLASARRIQELAISALETAARGVGLPPGVSVKCSAFGGHLPSRPHLMGLAKDFHVWVDIQVDGSSERVIRHYGQFVRTGDFPGPEYQLDDFVVWDREVTPAPTEALRLRFAAWAEAEVAGLLQKLEQALASR
ncbi:MAG: Fic family protein [Micrococcales bacterium]|nr:Fic family protein [Micrococcales bacterium]